MSERLMGLAALTLILWLHGAYLWRRSGKPAVTGSDRTWLVVTGVLCAAALIAAVAGLVCQWEGPLVHFLGLMCLLLSLRASYQIRRICGK